MYKNIEQFTHLQLHMMSLITSYNLKLFEKTFVAQ